MKITLKAARVNKGYTLEEAAKMLGITRGTLQNYEHGVTFPNGQTIEKMLKLYGAEYDDINFLPKNHA